MNLNLNKPETIVDYSSDLYVRSPIWLSDTFNGFFMVPNNNIWNYNFIGIKIEENKEENIYKVDNPSKFYDEIHRTGHFINFCKIYQNGEIE